MTDQISTQLAEMHLDLAQAIYDRRAELAIEVQDVSALSGISSERIEMIEEGDTTSLAELAVLADALKLTLQIDGLEVSLRLLGDVRWLQGPPQVKVETRQAYQAHVTATESQQPRFEAPRTASPRSFVHAGR